MSAVPHPSRPVSIGVWVGFCAVMGVINLWVALNFESDPWVNFKLFGGLGLMAVFVVAQALYLSRHMKTDEAPKP